MRRISRIVPLVLIVFATPFLLGTEKCDRDPLWQILREIGAQLDDLDQRVTALEECACDGVLMPVCGTDGLTYTNRCEAHCAGVRIVSPGECPQAVCGGDFGDTCDDMFFCEIPAGCDENAVGRCEEMPDGCPDVWAPVCGCDGETYGNDCERRAKGVPLDHRGECVAPPTVCADNEQCMDEEFCRKEAGQCDARGECKPRPEGCTREYAPVCGCDGKTYSNACVAASMGVSIDHRGMCEPRRCGGFAGLECESGEVCQYEAGTCEIADRGGICVPKPEGCLTVWDPVCSCDGDTYSNACEALAAGASVDYEGECRDTTLAR